MLGNEIEYIRMDEAEQKHWWYCSLHQRILVTIQKHFINNNNINILDAGCGTGGLMYFLREKGFYSLSGFDISEFAISACTRKGLSVFKESLLEISSHIQPNTLDVIVCSDALYFLPFDDQKKVVAQFSKLLKPGGLILLNLPALNIFSGIHDLSVGIKERYNHKILKNLIPENEYYFRYWPVLLSPVIAITRFFQRIKIKSGNYSLRSDTFFPGYLLNGFFKALMKLEMKYLPPINFGSSIFVVIKNK